MTHIIVSWALLFGSAYVVIGVVFALSVRALQVITADQYARHPERFVGAPYVRILPWSMLVRAGALWWRYAPMWWGGVVEGYREQVRSRKP